MEQYTLDYFLVTGTKLGGDLGEAMIAFANNPEDRAAADRLALHNDDRIWPEGGDGCHNSGSS